MRYFFVSALGHGLNYVPIIFRYGILRTAT